MAHPPAIDFHTRYQVNPVNKPVAGMTLFHSEEMLETCPLVVKLAQVHIVVSVFFYERGNGIIDDHLP